MRRLQVKTRHWLKRLIAALLPWSQIGRHRRSGLGRVWGRGRGPVHALDVEAMLDDAALAIEQGSAVRAELALAAARRAGPTSGRMYELEARAALLRGRSRDAVELLERDPRPSAQRRLLLALARTQCGDVATAMLDLAAWSRRPDCPPEARVLLAKLEADAGDEEAARLALGPSRQRPDHPLTCQMLVLLDTAEDLPLAAEGAASVLASAFPDAGRAAFNRRWLATLGLSPRTVRIEPDHTQVQQLARSLADHTETIGALVRAQRLEPRPTQLRLLRRALVRIADGIDRPLIAFEALAELAEIDGDCDDAARWARRALAAEPYSASMAMLLDRVSDGAPEADRAATRALERAHEAHPEYTDVRRALRARKERAA